MLPLLLPKILLACEEEGRVGAAEGCADTGLIRLIAPLEWLLDNERQL